MHKNYIMAVASKKRISAVFDSKVIEQIDTIRKIDRRSFSSMLEILVSEAIKIRNKK